MLNEYLLQKIYDIVTNDPGIDTPLVCLWVNEDDIPDPDFRGTELAAWFSEWHDGLWTKTCEHVDSLVEAGHIVFVDSGNLYPTGYQGDLV